MKKIKDLTKEEIEIICINHLCDNCPLCFGIILEECICSRIEYNKKCIKEMFPTGYADFLEREIEIKDHYEKEN